MKQLTILSTVFLSLSMAFNTIAAQSLESSVNSPNNAFTALDSLVIISDSIAADRYNKNKTNMTILAAWAGVNIIQGSISATNATESGEYFFKMNAYWNIVNLGIASWGLIQLKKSLPKNIPTPKTNWPSKN
jgi:hypothetical protein